MEVYHWVSCIGYIEGELTIDRQANTALLVSRWSPVAVRQGVNYTKQPMADVDLTADQADQLLVNYTIKKLDGRETYNEFERIQ